MGKLKFWYWVLGIVFALVALTVGLIQWKANRIFARHEADIKARIAEIRARSHDREPLFHDPLPGNAWDVYTQPLSAIDTIPDDDASQMMGYLRKQAPIPDLADAALLFEKYAPELDALRRALRMSEISPDHHYEDGRVMETLMGTRYSNVAELLHIGAEVRHDQGRDGEAADLLIVAFGVAHDLPRQGDYEFMDTSNRIEELAAFAWRRMLTGHSLNVADLERLAGTLDRLERTHPDIQDVIRVQDVTSRICLRTAERHYRSRTILKNIERWFRDRPARYFFSEDLARAAALDLLDGYNRKMERVARLPVHERETAAFDAAHNNLEYTSSNLLVTYLTAWWPSMRYDAAIRMWWTLMRTATALAWYEAEKGSMPSKLEDIVPRYLPRLEACPLTGKPLGYSPGKVWSYGFDGDDDGGKPMANENDESGDGDVVWTVKRKGM